MQIMQNQSTINCAILESGIGGMETQAGTGCFCLQNDLKEPFIEFITIVKIVEYTL